MPLPRDGRDNDLYETCINVIGQARYEQAAQALPRYVDIDFLGLIHDALWRDCKLQLAYGRADGEHVERLVDPLGLVAKGSAWYLVAATEQRDVRTYRVSGVQSARLVADAACAVPEGFDLAGYWEDSKQHLIAGVPRFSICLLADPAVVTEFKWTGRWARLESVGAPAADAASAWQCNSTSKTTCAPLC